MNLVPVCEQAKCVGEVGFVCVSDLNVCAVGGTLSLNPKGVTVVFSYDSFTSTNGAR